MKKLAYLIFLTLVSLSISSEQHIVKMLNAGKEGMMVFEPAYISVNKGDTVKFVATDLAHNSSSVEGMIPEGATPWVGAMSQDIEVTLTKEGVYVYQCTPHKAMGMIGLVIVGKDKSNLDKIKKVRVYGKSKKILKSLLKGL